MKAGSIDTKTRPRPVLVKPELLKPRQEQLYQSQDKKITSGIKTRAIETTTRPRPGVSRLSPEVSRPELPRPRQVVSKPRQDNNQSY